MLFDCHLWAKFNVFFIPMLAGSHPLIYHCRVECCASLALSLKSDLSAPLAECPKMAGDASLMAIEVTQKVPLSKCLKWQVMLL
jgi:hypothetical protein